MNKVDPFSEALEILRSFIEEGGVETTNTAGALLSDQLRAGNKVISCGNGGSMCDAMHFAEELTGRFRDDRPPIAAISISDPSHLSCVANDYGYEQVFARYVQAVGKAGDVLLAISTSGSSPNVVLAAQKAREMGMKVIALTGKDGGELAKNCDIEVRAPRSNYADRAQEVHIKVIHALIEYVEKNL
jgi:D-sedoheptulose 7-phosphate isomerase